MVANVLLIIGFVVALCPNTVLGQNLLAGEEKAPLEKAPIKVTSQQSTARTDRLIQKRLNEIFKNIEGLENLRVKVKAGIVELSGETLSAQVKDKATQLAERTEGVVEVQNNIREVQAIEKRLSAVLKLVRDRFGEFIAYLPLVLIALLVVTSFWFLGRLITRNDWLFRKASSNPFISHLIKQFVRGLFLIVGVLLAFEILDAGTV
ncbi:MAG: BON domain-containing protein, partial [Pseudomonadota bacterium]